MELIGEIGIVLIMLGLMLAFEFGWTSKKEREEKQDAETRLELTQGKDAQAKGIITYYKLNEKIRLLWKPMLILGVVLFLIGLFF